MTYPRIYKLGLPKTRENLDVEATAELSKRGILTTEEIDAMIKQADNLPTEYFRLRAKAIIALVKKSGKRRIEISRLQRTDLKVTKNEIEITFNLAKKHKKGFHQFITEIKKQIKEGKADPAVLNKPLLDLENDCRKWQETERGHNEKNTISLFSIEIKDKYALHVLQYLDYMKRYYDNSKFLFPSGRSVCGSSHVIDAKEHLSGRQLLRIIKPLNPRAWFHLFRETKGAEIAKANGRTLTAIYEVKDGLDLENEETAYRYVRRYVAKKLSLEK